MISSIDNFGTVHEAIDLTQNVPLKILELFSEACTPISLLHILSSSYCEAEVSFSAAQTTYISVR